MGTSLIDLVRSARERILYAAKAMPNLGEGLGASDQSGCQVNWKESDFKKAVESLQQEESKLHLYKFSRNQDDLFERPETHQTKPKDQCQNIFAILDRNSKKSQNVKCSWYDLQTPDFFFFGRFPTNERFRQRFSLEGIRAARASRISA